MKIENFTQLYETAVGPSTLISLFNSGHLMIEFLLRKLIEIYDPKLSTHADTLTNSRLISLSRDLKLISGNQKPVLIEINRIRNKFAHNITYKPTIRELRSLYEAALGAFDDLTDGISQGLSELEKAATVDDLDDWVFSELFVQISYDLHEEYHSRGGDVEDF